MYERERLLNLESEKEKVKEFDSVCLCSIEKERDSESDGLWHRERGIGTQGVTEREWEEGERLWDRNSNACSLRETLRFIAISSNPISPNKMYNCPISSKKQIHLNNSNYKDTQWVYALSSCNI